jgi:hypothetical protein
VKLLCVLALTVSAVCAQPFRVSTIDYYGVRKVPLEKLRKALAVKAGDPLPASKAEVEERLEAVPGVVEARLEAVCCEKGDINLFVGIEERGAPHFDLREPPAGASELPEEIVDTYRQFFQALETAVREGRSGDDLRSGHSLMADPATREIQEKFPALAEQHLAVLREVLKNSANIEHRAIAAYAIGYVPKKRSAVDDLQYAMRDPEDSVRNNAMRALAAISVLASRDPDLGIQIPPTWFVEMLNSVVWSDRNKAVMALVNLTDDRPEKVLSLVRERAMESLADMARWQSLPHAIGAYTLLGRVAGLTETQIQQTWEKGERETVIATAIKKKNK